MNKPYYLLPALFILMLFSCVQPPTTPEAPPNLTPDGSPLRISSVNPTSFSNDNDSRVTITGTGFITSTAFFVQSTKLEIVSLTRTQAIVIVPKRFLPSVYGIMVADNTGSRATLYPAFTISQAASTRAIDEEINYLSFVEGYVIDHETQQPIQDAIVGMPGLETTTNSSGYYLLRGVPIGRQALEIRKQGYEPLYRIAEVPVSSNGQTLTMKLSELEPKSTRVTMIGAAGGTHFASANGDAGPFLKIPAGALEKETPIQFTHLRTANTLPELPQDGYYLAFAHLGPTGLVFKKPATLFLPLQDGVEMPIGTPINISYFDAREAKWVDDITNGKISSVNGKLFLEYEINHFTWIGGQAPSDPVSFSIQDQNGNPLPRVTTNFGVTNAAGTVFGTIPRFSSEPVTVKPITPSNMTCTTPNSPTRVSGTPVNFTDPVVCNINSPLVSSPIAEGRDGCTPSDPVVGFGVGPRVALTSKTPVASSSGARPQATGAADSRVLLMTQDTFGFKTILENFKSGGSDASQTKFYLGSTDVTQKMRFKTLDNDSLELNLNLKEPLKAQAGLEIKLETTKWGGEKVESKVSADVVAKFTVPQVQIWVTDDFVASSEFDDPSELEYDSSDGTSNLIGNQDELVWSQHPVYLRNDESFIEVVVRPLDFDTLGEIIEIPVPVTAVDEKGQAISINSNFQLSFPEARAKSNQLVNGKATIGIKVQRSDVSINQLLNLKSILIDSTSINTMQSQARLQGTGICVAQPSDPLNAPIYAQINTPFDPNNPNAPGRPRIVPIWAALRQKIQQNIRMGQPFEKRLSSEEQKLKWAIYQKCITGTFNETVYRMPPAYRSSSRRLSAPNHKKNQDDPNDLGERGIAFDGIVGDGIIVDTKFNDQDIRIHPFNPNRVHGDWLVDKNDRWILDKQTKLRIRDPNRGQPFYRSRTDFLSNNTVRRLLRQADQNMDLVALGEGAFKIVRFQSNDRQLVTLIDDLLREEFKDEFRAGGVRAFYRPCP